MSKKYTRKEIRNKYKYILKFGACDIQTLLKYENKIAHIERSEGWAADVYEIYIPEYGSIAIVTGYDPIGNIDPKYDFFRPYEERARNYYEKHKWNSNYPYSRKKKYLHDRLVNMCKKAIEKYSK